MKNTYRKGWGVGGYEIRAKRHGWIVSQWSRVPGSRTGRRVLVPYRSACDATTSLINAHRLAEWIVTLSRRDDACVLAVGLMTLVDESSTTGGEDE